ncbi:DUF742 domain-containing protein [Streptomyces sp. TRM 70361]|uniref:DUF742 domain-containing protein n=1 Tax=Streptomyces sp. TRM 70361 TaxID=3116553 RepID=UPI002E7ACB14|nr:DUF742 domain-containing protein [Streptomyces sp. TRM 70361]MEE1942120.1 DUF742 domain-containing protein [Streptomyces sp. TRM 70361]
MTEEPDFEVVGELVRPYVITSGRTLPSDREFSVTTLVTASEKAQQSRVLDPESRSILELCSGGFLSIAEIAGHTGLPLGVVRVVLSDLAESKLIYTRAPVPVAERADRQLLEDVLHGLRSHFA